MASDRTQHQSSEELRKARELSLESARPPAAIPGYKLQRFIGSGAYGEVWSATDLKTGRKVAVKFYTRRSNADVQLLAQEVQKLVVLSNDSYVVGLLDVGWDANPPYYVMDYIESGSLEDRLKSGDGMPTSEAIELFQDIATGMMLLHAKGILHCDLKPGNVLLDQHGKPRVADFGQARLSSDQTPALGTLFFMAPEQADMNAIPDAGWDVYGLGALLYCMLTGKPPYYSADRSKTIEASEQIGERLSKYRETLLAARMPTEHRQIPGVDRSLGDIIDKCIAADPKKRFSNVQSILLALRQRDLTRARQPLMLLGLLGPILLMGVVSLFGWWAVDQAMSQTKIAVTARAQESNDYAAKLAARSASEQVEEYFRAVSQLAHDQSFHDVFDSVIADKKLEKLRIRLADPSLNSNDGVEPNPEIAQVRNDLEGHELRKSMQQTFLEVRLNDRDNDYPPAASWFVSDRYGNQIASVFSESDNITLGNNFSFRTYFTGEDKDLELTDPRISGNGEDQLAARPIIDSPHLSAVFQSLQSKTWKVAFSAPIIRYGEVQGIVAVTVDLGNLIEFQNIPSQYVMLVDERVGENKGAVLEHPLFNIVLDEQAKQHPGEKPRLPEELAKMKVDWNLQKFPYRDPVGDTDLGKLHGYDRASIISSVKVQDMGSSLESDENTTGLEVVAVQDFENVLADVNNLGTQFGRLAALAGLIVLGLMLGMLWFVNRMMRESRERLARAFSPTRDSTDLQELDTIAIAGRPKTLDYSSSTDGPNGPTHQD